MSKEESLHVSVLGPFPGDRASALLGDKRSPALTALPHEGGHPLSAFVTHAVAQGHRRSVVSLSRAYTGKPLCLHSGRFSFYLASRRKRHEIRSLYRNERAHVVHGIEELRPDVVHAHWTNLYALGALDSARPTLFTIHDHAAHILRCLGPRYIGNYLITLHVLRKARCLTAVSPYIAEYVERIAGRQVTVIPNCVSDELVALSAREEGPARKRGNNPAIASAVSAADFKNAKGAIRAFAATRKQVPDARYDLVGHGTDTAGEIATWARDHGLAEGVTFHGAILNSRFLEILDAADVLLHPSLEEAFPGPPLEGMALGKTVVAGQNTGGCPWQLDEGRAGVLVDVRSPAAMAERLVDILNRPEMYAAQRTHARRLIQTRYSPHAVAGAYQAMYDRLYEEWARDHT